MTRLSFRRADLPDGFVFGTATSAYQIEGTQFGGCGPCHWDSYAATPGNVVRGEDGALACDHYHRWEADLDLVRDAGLDAYRFSTSWARIMPEGRGAVNAEGLDFYDRLVDGMLARGIRPAATLYHWELPQALADAGGWRNRDIAGWFGDFTEVVMARLGDRLDSVAPINEPWCVTWLSHFLGLQAPGMRDIRATARAMHHVLLAHGTAIAAMRARGIRNLGAVMNFEYAHAAEDTEDSRRAAALYDGIYNRWFMSGVFEKRYPANVLEGLAPHMPEGWEEDFDLIGQKLDWIGVNYYTCQRIAHDPHALWPHLASRPGPLPKTALGWEIYPEGLHHFLHMVHGMAGGLPIVVTENGLAADDGIEDESRIAYLDAHVAQVRRAIDEGVPVAGYYSWSLLDNYEWSFGYDKRFGLVHVDFETLERRPKASYHALRAALEAG